MLIFFMGPLALPCVHKELGFCFTQWGVFSWKSPRIFPNVILVIKATTELKTTGHSNNCKHFNSKNEGVCKCSVTQEGSLGSENQRTFLGAYGSAGRDRPGLWEIAGLRLSSM